MCFISYCLGRWWGKMRPWTSPCKLGALFMTACCPSIQIRKLPRTQGAYRQWVRAENTHTASGAWSLSSSGRYSARILESEGSSKQRYSPYGASLSHHPGYFIPSLNHCLTLFWLLFLVASPTRMWFHETMNLIHLFVAVSPALSHRRCFMIICRMNKCKKIEVLKMNIIY